MPARFETLSLPMNIIAWDMMISNQIISHDGARIAHRMNYTNECYVQDTN